MEGTNLFRVRSALGHMLLRPKDAGRWLLDNVLLRRTAIERDLPWMSWKAIDFLQGYITPGLRVFEWGGGGSTIFFADRGCHVTTIESSEFWKDGIQNRYRARERSGSVEIRFIPAETRDPRAITEYIQMLPRLTQQREFALFRNGPTGISEEHAGVSLAICNRSGPGKSADPRKPTRLSQPGKHLYPINSRRCAVGRSRH